MATANAINANSTGIVKYDGAGTFTATTTTNHSILVGAASNGITNIALTNGQLAIGSTGADPVAATITAGTGVSVSNGAGTITINAIGAGLTWTAVTGATQVMAVNNGYIANRAGTVAFTLPTTSAVGDIVAVTGINTATGWSIAYTTNQQIFFGTSSATITTGSLASVNIRDTVFLVCVTANLTWNVFSSIGNITVA
jgi:hypothetical protein